MHASDSHTLRNKKGKTHPANVVKNSWTFMTPIYNKKNTKQVILNLSCMDIKLYNLIELTPRSKNHGTSTLPLSISVEIKETA